MAESIRVDSTDIYGSSSRGVFLSVIQFVPNITGVLREPVPQPTGKLLDPSYGKVLDAIQQLACSHTCFNHEGSIPGTHGRIDPQRCIPP